MLQREQPRRGKELQAAGVGPSALATPLGVDRKTVRKYLAQADFSPTPPVANTGPSTRDPYGPVIQQWLADDQRTFHKPQHTAQRIWERLRAEYPDFVGSYSLVPRYGKGLRTPGPTTGTLELVWHPGECPGDFGTAEAVVDGVAQTCQYLTGSFPDSNAGDLQRFGGETAEGLLTGLPAVFTRLGGVPKVNPLSRGTPGVDVTGRGVRAADAGDWTPDEAWATRETRDGQAAADQGHPAGGGIDGGGGGRLRDLRDELARMGDPVALAIRHGREVVTVPEEGQAQRVSVVTLAGPCPVRIVLASA